MSLVPGTKLGVYTISEEIGAGGMGVVYRATDTRLKRQVAIKILPPSLAADPDRLARFQREAEVLASLNHPNIAAIYGLEEFRSGGSSDPPATALVMELVEGDDLSQLIARLRAPGASEGQAGKPQRDSGPGLKPSGARHQGLPVEDVLNIARQIAEALEAAHEQGIIHRDLKPANIKVRADGTVKVLDFGLAKAMEPGVGRGLSPAGTAGSKDPAYENVSQSPTLTSPSHLRQGYGAAGTEAGMILGTAAYMSPEQARGKVVDKRADIWAFGAVLYEMITGRRVFAGTEIADVLAAVLRQDVDWTALPAATPPRLRRLLARCLDRDPRTRLRDIGEARVELDKNIAGVGDGAADDAGVPPTSSATPSSAARARLAWAAFAVAAIAALALAIPALRYLRQTPTPAPPETRTDIVTPPTDSPASFALSPDGRQIVFAASGRLWLRSLATTTAQVLADTEGATYPFWAPDSRSIGFSVGPALKRLDLSGGATQLAAMSLGGTMQGGTWNADGVIVYAPGVSSPLMRVTATGGTPVAVTTLVPGQQGHVAPFFLPDGRRFLYYAVGGPGVSGIYLSALDGSAPVKLTSDLSMGTFLPSPAWRVEATTDGGTRPADASSDGGPRSAEASGEGGWLLWVRGSALVAQRLDLDKAALTGEPVTVAGGVAVNDGSARNAVSVSGTGLLAYRTGAGARRQLTWVDRSGTTQGTFGDADSNNLNNPRVSPDGRLVVVGRMAQGNQDLWLLDGTRTSRFTFDAAAEQFPVWSPDGTRVVFRSRRSGGGDLYQKLASGAGQEELLVTSGESMTPMSWSADGRFVLYHVTGTQGVPDLWVVPMAGDRTPSVFLKTPFYEARGVFSPDGRWVAYQSNESGRMEVYVRPFVPPSPQASADKSAVARNTSAVNPAPSPGSADSPGVTSGASPLGGQWQVSSTGGIMPLWRRDGKELYYLNPAGAMMAAPITITGSTVVPGAPVVLFPTHIVDGGVDTQQGRQYDVAPDGRFLINTALDSAAAPITLLQNWNPETKK